MAAFLDVHLEQVAQVVQARAGQPEVALLLDRGRLGIALRDDDAAQVSPVFARDILPCVLADMVAEMNLAAGFSGIQEDPPAVIRHLYVAELRPALRIDADRGAQVDVETLAAFRPHVVPP